MAGGFVGPTPLQAILEGNEQNNRLIMNAAQLLTDQWKTRKQLEEMARQADMEHAKALWDHLMKNTPGGSLREFSTQYGPIASFLFDKMGFSPQHRDMLLEAMRNSTPTIEQKIRAEQAYRVYEDFDPADIAQTVSKTVADSLAKAQAEAERAAREGAAGEQSASLRQQGTTPWQLPTPQPTSSNVGYGPSPVVVGFETEGEPQLDTSPEPRRAAPLPVQTLPADAFARELAGRQVEPAEVDQVLHEAGGRPYAAVMEQGRRVVKEAPNWKITGDRILGSVNLTPADLMYVAVQRLGRRIDKNNPADMEFLRGLAVESMRRTGGLTDQEVLAFGRGNVWDHKTFGMNTKQAELMMPRSLEEAQEWSRRGREFLAQQQQQPPAPPEPRPPEPQPPQEPVRTVPVSDLSGMPKPTPEMVREEVEPLRKAAGVPEQTAGRLDGLLSQLEQLAVKFASGQLSASDAGKARRVTYDYDAIQRHMGYTPRAWTAMVSGVAGMSLEDYLARTSPSAESTERARLKAAQEAANSPAGILAAMTDALKAHAEFVKAAAEAENAERATAAEVYKLQADLEKSKLGLDRERLAAARDELAFKRDQMAIENLQLQINENLKKWEHERSMRALEQQIKGMSLEEAKIALQIKGVDWDIARSKLVTDENGKVIGTTEGMLDAQRLKLLEAQTALAQLDVQDRAAVQKFLANEGMAGFDRILQLPSVQSAFSMAFKIVQDAMDNPPKLNNPEAVATYNAAATILNKLGKMTAYGEATIKDTFPLIDPKTVKPGWWQNLWKGPAYAAFKERYDRAFGGQTSGGAPAAAGPTGVLSDLNKLWQADATVDRYIEMFKAR